MADLARRLRRLVATSDPESDANLLDRFIADRDGLAFAALVARHGPMVLAVCRRVLGHRQDAEDAFQATFLVLARRADVVKPRALLGNWLYGVAYRTARAARRVALTRRARETKAAVMRAGDEAADDNTLAPELREVLDRELAALPDVYRAALVACDLEGLTRREAAVRLGWTEGTLSSRLARARSLLARRLCRYGLTVPAAGMTVVAGPVAVASGLAEPTVRLGTLVAAGEAVVAAPVAALMEGAMGTMFLTKLKALAAVVVVGCAVAMTSVAAWRAEAAGAADPPKVADVPKSPGTPKATDAPKRAVANTDKERIAELERERELLMRQVAQLRAEAEAEAEAFRAEAAALQKYVARAAELEKRKAEQDAARTALEAAKLGRSSNTPSTPEAPAAKNRDPVAPKRTDAGTTKAVVRVYPVGDLAGDEKEGEALVKVLRAAVVPTSWQTVGGDGVVEYLPGKKVLVVRQTANAHDELAELLKQLQTQSAPGKK